MSKQSKTRVQNHSVLCYCPQLWVLSLRTHTHLHALFPTTIILTRVAPKPVSTLTTATAQTITPTSSHTPTPESLLPSLFPHWLCSHKTYPCVTNLGPLTRSQHSLTSQLPSLARDLWARKLTPCHCPQAGLQAAAIASHNPATLKKPAAAIHCVI